MTHCPACGAAGGEVFHDVDAVPVQDAALLPDRAAALGVPTGRLRLAVCAACGFAWNTAFDETAVEYGPGYEESQAASPRFRRFSDELAGALAGRYLPAGGSVLEVGCGKGDFLARLCRVTGARGTGFDPVWVPGRVDVDGLDVRVEARRFTAADAGAVGDVDLVVCRHTLEHVPAVAELLGQLARAADRRPGAVYVEVPDLQRVLDEGAFWDLYYEHCSYFTAGALARLGARCGLRVERLSRVFDDQYLALEGRPGADAAPADEADVSDAADVVAAALRFRERVDEVLTAWRDRLAAVCADGRRVAVWGASSKAVGFLSALALGGRGSPAVELLVDIDARKAGRWLPGLPQQVVGPADLPPCPPDVVVVMNPVYRDEIGAELDRLGVRAVVEAL